MKTLKTALLSLCVLAIVSCRDTPRDVHTTDRDHTTTTEPRTDGNQMDQTRDQQRTGTTQDMTRVYTHLDMTPDQIRQFEEREREYYDQTRADQTELQRRRDDNLRAILSSDQYRKYEQWKRDNPPR